jgi:hypothetical protein
MKKKKMKLRKYIRISLTVLVLASCTRPSNYVIETDFNQLMPDTINGETEKESQKKSQEFYKLLLSNTIDKTIPDIEIFTVDGKKLNLRDVLNTETIIISSDNHCGWGLEALTNDFPNAMKNLQNEIPDINIICLFKREKSDIENPVAFNKTLNELKLIYESVYVIDENQAYKINLFPNPTRLYVNENKVVTHIGIGTSLIENRLLDEIKENTGANNAYTL